MRLYLVQHGEAKPKEEDPERPLTEIGTRNVEKMAEFLGTNNLQVLAVWHSGKRRAEQTTEILEASIGAGGYLHEQEGLSPNDAVGPIVEEINGLDDDLMIVGHLPFLGKLVTALVAGSDSGDVVAFRQGGVVCLERDEEGVWRVAWMVTPDLVD